MKKTNRITIFLITALLPLTPVIGKAIPLKSLETEWSFYGIGAHKAQSRLLYMEEGPESKGVMLVSPKAYSGDLTIRYEIMPMTAASVCVAMICASDAGESEDLTIPAGYDGSMGLWVKEMDNYFFAFHNAAHNRAPFLNRFPASERLAILDKNVMRAGEFHRVEIKKCGAKLSFYINGKRLYSIKDQDPLESGYIAFRIRGISEQAASCMIRNLEIESKD